MNLRRVLILTVLFLVGCATWRAELERNNRNLLKLEPGMTKEQVLSIMGEPRMNESYGNLNNVPTTIWFYYTERKHSDGSFTKDEMTPVVFQNSVLAGWGDEFYESKVIYEIRNR